MQKFYFIVRDRLGGVTDNEGAELPSLQAAIRRATIGARSIMSEDVKSGELDLTGAIDIEDAARTVVASVTYAEVIKIINA